MIFQKINLMMMMMMMLMMMMMSDDEDDDDNYKGIPNAYIYTHMNFLKTNYS